MKTNLQQAQEWLKRNDGKQIENAEMVAYALATFLDEQEKPKECEHKDYTLVANSRGEILHICMKCNTSRVVSHSQPTPVPEELKGIGCSCRCRGMCVCPHNERRSCGCRDCNLELKVNELIRYLKSRNQ